MQRSNNHTDANVTVFWATMLFVVFLVVLVRGFDFSSASDSSADAAIEEYSYAQIISESN